VETAEIAVHANNRLRDLPGSLHTPDFLNGSAPGEGLSEGAIASINPKKLERDPTTLRTQLIARCRKLGSNRNSVSCRLFVAANLPPVHVLEFGHLLCAVQHVPVSPG